MDEVLKIIKLYIIKNLRRVKKRYQSKFVSSIEYCGRAYNKTDKNSLRIDIEKDIDKTFGIVPIEMIQDLLKKI